MGKETKITPNLKTTNTANIRPDDLVFTLTIERIEASNQISSLRSRLKISERSTITNLELISSLRAENSQLKNQLELSQRNPLTDKISKLIQEVHQVIQQFQNISDDPLHPYSIAAEYAKKYVLLRLNHLLGEDKDDIQTARQSHHDENILLIEELAEAKFLISQEKRKNRLLSSENEDLKDSVKQFRKRVRIFNDFVPKFILLLRPKSLIGSDTIGDKLLGTITQLTADDQFERLN